METIRSPEKALAFLTVLAETGNVTRAADACGAGRRTMYDWRLDDPEFAAAWDKAIDCATLGLEDEARRRAAEGIDEPVFHLGVRTDVVKKYSDTLLIFLLKAHNPEKYRERSNVELTGAGGGPVQLAPADRLARLAGLLASIQQRGPSEEIKSDDNAQP